MFPTKPMSIQESGRVPAHIIDRLFADENLLPLRRGKLGGHKLPDKPLIHGAPMVRVIDVFGETTVEPMEGYMSQSSYSPEQTEWIFLAKQRLSSLAVSAKNVDTGEKAEGYQGLKHAIVEAFTAQEGPKNFERAVVDGTLGLFALFAREHANLQGVIEGLFKVAAAEGAADSILSSAGFLEAAIDGRLTRENAHAYAYIDQRDGAQAHPDFEGSCIALDTGMMIKASAAYAALQIKDTLNVPNYQYVAGHDTKARESLAAEIKGKVLALRSSSN